MFNESNTSILKEDTKGNNLGAAKKPKYISLEAEYASKIEKALTQHKALG